VTSISTLIPCKTVLSTAVKLF